MEESELNALLAGKYREEIDECREDIKYYIRLAVPGFLWFIAETAMSLTIFNDTPNRINNIASTLPLMAAWVPFEMAEGTMLEMKMKIREYCRRTSTTIAPIQYTKTELFVNSAMRLLFDKSPLTPDR